MFDIDRYIDVVSSDWLFYVVCLIFTAICWFIFYERDSCSDHEKALFELDLAHRTIRTVADNELKLRQHISVITKERDNARRELSETNKLLFEASDILKELNSNRNVSLFDFDDVVGKSDLRHRYKLLAKVFHPDAGGSTELMQVLNAQYQKVKR